MRQVRLAWVAALLLCGGCSREPVCYPVPSAHGTRQVESTKDHEAVLIVGEAFVIAHPPDGGEKLVEAVLRLCGQPKAPGPGHALLQWTVFRESWKTPRDVVFGSSKHDRYEAHADDLLLDLSVTWRDCKGTASYTYQPDLDDPARKQRPPPRFAVAGGCGP